jgi:hypothetical protein
MFLFQLSDGCVQALFLFDNVDLSLRSSKMEAELCARAFPESDNSE